MMKRIMLAILLAACLALPVCSVGESASSVAAVLASDTWQADATGTAFTFREDGTGTVSFSGGVSYDTTWLYDGMSVSITYDLFGPRTFSYVYAELDGAPALITLDGSAVFRQAGQPAAPAPTSAPRQAEELAFGQTIDLPFMKLSFQRAEVTRQIMSSNGSFYPVGDGQKFFSLVADVENTGGRELSVSNIRAEFTFDGAYTYSGQVRMDHGGNLTYNLPPLGEGTLFLFAAIPDKLVDTFATCEVTFSFEDNLASAPSSASAGAHLYRIAADETICAAAKEGPVREMSYIPECPVLPDPTSYLDMYQSGRNSSSTNGKVRSIRYTFAPLAMNDDVQPYLDQYLQKLEKEGFVLQKNGAETTLHYNGRKVASALIENNRIRLNVEPGNEGLTPSSSGANPAATPEPVSLGKPVALGDTIHLDNLTMTLDKQGIGDTLYSSVTKRKSGYYQYLEPEKDHEIYYLRGTFKNLGGAPVDIRNIYVTFTFDGKYAYQGSVEGAVEDSNVFINDVNPLSTVTYYMYTNIPKELVGSFSQCQVRIGFTDDFGIKFVQNGLYDFTRCEEVFLLTLDKNGKSAAPVSGTVTGSAPAEAASSGFVSGNTTVTVSSPASSSAASAPDASSGKQEISEEAYMQLLLQGFDPDAMSYEELQEVAASLGINLNEADLVSQLDPAVYGYLVDYGVDPEALDEALLRLLVQFDAKSFELLFAYGIDIRSMDAETLTLCMMEMGVEPRKTAAATPAPTPAPTSAPSPTPPPAQSYVFAFENSAYTLLKKETLKLAPVLQGTEAQGKPQYTWESSDTAVAKVKNGTVTAVNAGTATITCTMTDKTDREFVASCQVEVLQPVTAVKPQSSKAVVVAVDGTVQLTPSIQPENASNKALRYSSSNTDVATVDANGVVTGKQNGTCSITMESTDGSGKKGKQSISVVPFVIDVEEIVITERGTYDLELPYADPISGMMLKIKKKGFFDVGNVSTASYLSGGYNINLNWLNGGKNHLYLNPLKAGTTTISIMNSNAFFGIDTPRVKYDIKVTVEHSAVYDSTSFPALSYNSALDAGNAGRLVSFTGVILEAGTSEYTVATKGKTDDPVIVTMGKYGDRARFNIGEKITVYGAVAAPRSHVTDTGLTKTTPVVEAEKINDAYLHDRFKTMKVEVWD